MADSAPRGAAPAPLRLLVVGPGHPFRGGIAKTTSELVRSLAERGHGMRFLTPIRQYPASLYPGADDRDPEACPQLDCAIPCLDPLNIWTWTSVRRRATAGAYDAWIMPYWTWAWAGLGWFLLRASKRPPVVAVVHNPVDHDAGAMQRLAARAVLRRCQALFTHAEVLGSLLRSSYPGVPVAVHPLPAPDHLPLPDRRVARSELGLEASARVALFMGLIRSYKGVDLLVEAFANLKGTSWRLVVAGEPWGNLGADLGRRVRRHGLEDVVRLDLRWLSEDEVRLRLAAADVVVLPYRSGSQSAVAPLAMGHGVPVVSSRVGGLAEVVEHGVNGLLVEPDSVDQLVEALAGLDRRQLDQFAAGARATAATLSWDGYARELERLIQRVVAP